MNLSNLQIFNIKERDTKRLSYLLKILIVFFGMLPPFTPTFVVEPENSGLFFMLPVYDSREIIHGVIMKKIILAILCVSLVGLMAGCSAEKLKTKKLRDIEFTVVDKDDIPDELEDMIDEKDKKPFKLTYADDGALYIAVGYGEQPTSGYSIEVKEAYETENAIYIHTNLIGPAKDEKVLERKTYPYIVIKTEFMDKNVVFE